MESNQNMGYDINTKDMSNPDNINTQDTHENPITYDNTNNFNNKINNVTNNEINNNINNTINSNINLCNTSNIIYNKVGNEQNVPEPKLSNPNIWTPNEDATLIWSLFLTPLIEYLPSSRSILINSKTRTDIGNRYDEIMNSIELQRIVQKEFQNNIFAYRNASWHRRESYYLFFLAQNFHFDSNVLTLSHFQSILESYPLLFHPSRTPKSLLIQYKAQKEKGIGTASKQHEYLVKYHHKIHNSALNITLLPFPGFPYSNNDSTDDSQNNLELLHITQVKAFVESILKDSSQSEISEISNLCWNSFIEPINWKKHVLAAFIASKVTWSMSKPTITIGRASLKIKPDINLERYNLKTISRCHMTIRYCSDFNFYLQCDGNWVIINGKVIKKGEIVQIHDGDLIDVGGLVIGFIENKNYLIKLQHFYLSRQEKHVNFE